MRSIGLLLIVLVIGSFILRLLEMEFRLLRWVDEWGTGTGNIIRIYAAAIGALLYFLGIERNPGAQIAQL